ncbi:MAG: stalk domain-containing protein [Bacillota bacterium]
MNFKQTALGLGVGVALALTPLSNVNASTAIPVYVNGAKQTYDQPAVVKSGRTLVPIRGISEDLGATVRYNNENKKISIKDQQTTVTLTIGSKTAYINGEKKQLDVPAEVEKGRTIVPLRFVGEAFDAKVSYNSKTRTAHIVSQSFEKLVDEHQEKVVTIHKYKNGQPYINRGAGVMVSPSLVLTTKNAVNYGEGAIIETSDGKKVQAEGIVDMDSEHNLALVKLSEPLNIEPAIIGFDSAITKGDKAVSLDSKTGVEVKIDGIDTRHMDQIYTNTPYRNSYIGTPLFNYDGEVIGLSYELDLAHTVEFYGQMSEVKKWSSFFSMKHSEIETSGFYKKLPTAPIKTFKDVSLGMTFDQVKALENKETHQESNSYLSYKDDDTIGPNGYVSYEFYPKEKVLHSISYQYTPKKMTRDEATQMFQELINRIETVHGAPYKTDTSWGNDEDKYAKELTAWWPSKFNEEKPAIYIYVVEGHGVDPYGFELFYGFDGNYRK